MEFGASACEHNSMERAQCLHSTPELLALFNRYPWPGNGRELRNMLTFALCLLEDDASSIGTEHPPQRFPESFDEVPEATSLSPGAAGSTFTEASAHAERKVILEVPARAGQNRSRAARELKISRNKLYKKMHNPGLLPN